MTEQHEDQDDVEFGDLYYTDTPDDYEGDPEGASDERVEQLAIKAYVAAVQVVNDSDITTAEAVDALERAVVRIKALLHNEA